MRVIAGTARGMTLKGPTTPGTRPTSDKVRGAIFDMLVQDVCGARTLDLYAGTGALGVEALSRGAASCLFVEKVSSACQVIEGNLRATRLGENAYVWRMDACKALDLLSAQRREGDGGGAMATSAPMAGESRPGQRRSRDGAAQSLCIPSTFGPPYDVIILDPPYGDPGIAGVMQRVFLPALLAADGVVVLEHGKRVEVPVSPGFLRVRRAKSYGDTAVTIWERTEEIRA